jgi:hypothetical protein
MTSDFGIMRGQAIIDPIAGSHSAAIRYRDLMGAAI